MKKSICLLAVCTALPAHSGALGPFDEIFVFGDSLSDGGNLQVIAPEFVPNPPYPNGQFTNGETWTTQLGLTPSLLGGTNFAFGGARTVDNSPVDAIPDLLAQIAAFTSSRSSLGANSLGVIWIGGNDFLDFPVDPLPTEEEFAGFVGGVAGTINTGVQQLVGAGISDVVVFGQPSFGALPQFNGDPVGAAVADGASFLLNTAIEATAAGLNAALPDADVSFFDLDAIFQDVLADLPDETQQLQCLETLGVEGCLANPDDFLFFDDIHPVEDVHTILAEAFADEFLQPVPLPAGGVLLLTGLAGFGVWARRRKSLT